MDLPFLLAKSLTFRDHGLTSGFSETKDVKAAQKLGAGKYIKKPYTMAKIGLAVKEELEK